MFHPERFCNVIEASKLPLQSLAMYVPPDEPVQEMGEINMTFQDEHGRQIHHTGTHIVDAPGAHMSLHPHGGASVNATGAHGTNGHGAHAHATRYDEDPEVIAAINPIYQRSGY